MVIEGQVYVKVDLPFDCYMKKSVNFRNEKKAGWNKGQSGNRGYVILLCLQKAIKQPSKVKKHQMANVALNILRTYNFSIDAETIQKLVPSAGYNSYTQTRCFFSKENKLYGGEDWYFTSKWDYIDPGQLKQLLVHQNSMIWCIQAGESREFDVIYSISKRQISLERYAKYAFDEIKIEFHENYLKDLKICPPENTICDEDEDFWIFKIQGFLNSNTSDDFIVDKYFEEPRYDMQGLLCDNEIPFRYSPQKEVRDILQLVEPYYKSIRFCLDGNELLFISNKNDPKYYHSAKSEDEVECFHYDRWECKFDWLFCADEEYVKWMKSR